MDKKFILIPLGIGVALLLLITIFSKDKTGNHFQMTYPDVKKESSVGVDSVTVYLDNSVSMKGFVDFAGISSVKSSMIGVIGNMMDNVFSKFRKEAVCFCGEKSYNRRQFLDGMENFSIFSGQTTELHKMIQEVSRKSKANDVSIIVTDMILSYGSKELLNHKDTLYNLHQLDNLGAQVHNAMTSCKSKGLDVMVLQYLSPFNGSYYCNFTENLRPNRFAGKMMENRPYYMMVIGKKELLKSMMGNHCFDKPAHVYASFKMDDDNMATQDFQVKAKGGMVSWLVGDPDNPDNDGSISTTANFGEERSTLLFSCKRFDLPEYVSVDEQGRLKPDWDKASIENVEQIDENADEMTFLVSMKPHNQLQTADGVWVRLNSDVSWVSLASTDDDTKGDDISGKTWGLSTVISNINKAYNGKPEMDIQAIAEFKFNIIIK